MGLALVALLALLACMPQAPVANGVTMSSSDEPRHVMVVQSRTAAATIEPKLTPADYGTVLRTDFRRHVLVAAFVRNGDPCIRVAITRVHVVRRTLVAHVTAMPLGDRGSGGCITVVATAYDIVKIPRTAFGNGVPRKAALRLSVST